MVKDIWHFATYYHLSLLPYIYHHRGNRRRLTCSFSIKSFTLVPLLVISFLILVPRKLLLWKKARVIFTQKILLHLSSLCFRCRETTQMNHLSLKIHMLFFCISDISLYGNIFEIVLICFFELEIIPISCTMFIWSCRLGVFSLACLA